MARTRQETTGGLDHMLLTNVLSILEHQAGTGVLSFRAAYDIYVAIANDLGVTLPMKELADIGYRLEAAGFKMPDM
jgi:hypothetical protein